MKTNKKIWLVAVCTIAIGLICTTTGMAKKPDNPGGGKPGGGGGTQPRFSVIEIPIHNGTPYLSEADQEGIVTIAIEGAEAGYVSGAFARVNRNDRTVLSYGFLPEPVFVDPNDGIEKNGGSNPRDVNSAGQIVGSAQTYVPNSPDISPSRAQLWVNGGAGYTRTALPELSGARFSQANGINSQGDIVGLVAMGTGDQAVWRAVLWDADSLDIADLNTLIDAPSLGWDLRSAVDINDDGLITGFGRLNGAIRGFVLDTATQQISAVPLADPAQSNVAYEINSQGRVIGDMWEGDEDASPFGSNPGFWSAYSWDGTESEPGFLPSATNNTSIVVGLNDGDATVGISIVPEGGLFPTTVPTLWEPDENGIIQAIDLRDTIPNKPEYRLDWATDINNDGWIGASGRKFDKGKYTFPTLLLVPNASSAASLAGAAIPEPSTFVLSVAAFVGVSRLMNRRMKHERGKI